MRYWLFIVFVTAGLITKSQKCDPLLSQQFYESDGITSAEIHDISVGPDGSIAITGYRTREKGGFPLYTAQLDSNMSLLWESQHFYGYEEKYTGLGVINAGTSIFCVGEYWSDWREMGYRVLKYDATGDTVWTRAISNQSDQFRELLQFYSRQDTIHVLYGTHTSYGYVTQLVKVDSSGNTKYIDFDFPDSTYLVNKASRTSDGFALFGNYLDAGQQKPFIAAVDESGKTKYVESFPQAGFGSPVKLIETFPNDYMLTLGHGGLYDSIFCVVTDTTGAEVNGFSYAFPNGYNHIAYECNNLPGSNIAVTGRVVFPGGNVSMLRLIISQEGNLLSSDTLLTNSIQYVAPFTVSTPEYHFIPFLHTGSDEFRIAAIDTANQISWQQSLGHGENVTAVQGFNGGIISAMYDDFTYPAKLVRIQEDGSVRDSLYIQSSGRPSEVLCDIQSYQDSILYTSSVVRDTLVIRKLNNSLTASWEQRISLDSFRIYDNTRCKIAIDPTGGVFAAYSIFKPLEESRIRLLSLSAQGTINWETTLTIEELRDDYFTDFFWHEDGYLVLLGLGAAPSATTSLRVYKIDPFGLIDTLYKSQISSYSAHFIKAFELSNGNVLVTYRDGSPDYNSHALVLDSSGINTSPYLLESYDPQSWPIDVSVVDDRIYLLTRLNHPNDTIYKLMKFDLSGQKLWEETRSIPLFSSFIGKSISSGLGDKIILSGLEDVHDDRAYIAIWDTNGSFVRERYHPPFSFGRVGVVSGNRLFVGGSQGGMFKQMQGVVMVLDTLLQIKCIDTINIDNFLQHRFEKALAFGDGAIMAFQLNADVHWKWSLRNYENSITGIQKEGSRSINQESPVALWPNPASNKVTVSWEMDIQPEQVLVYDTHGRLLRSITVNPDANNSMELDISDLGSSAIILIGVASQSETIYRKIVKVK